MGCHITVWECFDMYVITRSLKESLGRDQKWMMEDQREGFCYVPVEQ